MDNVTLEEVVRQHLRLSRRPNSSGWFSILCKVCNDHGRKGPRAGFRFDGESVAYHCFNCGHSTVYDPASSKSMPRKMVEVLNAFNIPEEEWQAVILSHLDGEAAKPWKVRRTEIEPKAIDLPSYFRPLGNDSSSQLADAYLETRGITRDQYSFYVANRTDDPSSHKWFGRLIIPVYKDNHLIFFQGRDMTGKRDRPYLSPAIPRDNILFGYAELFQNDDFPLYITEGWFDAFVINGVAVYGNQLTSNQINWLRQSRREKVVIPDQRGEGFLLAEQAVKLGWSVSTPDIGSCKDVNDAFVKYGKLYTLRTIKENTASGHEALVKVGLYCERKKDDLSRSARKGKKTPKKGWSQTR